MMSNPESDKCFVIMPFGIKPLKDGSGGMYDFDKVYRVIIKRAIRQAGMEAVRADEQTGAHIIHTDMFKELRDRAVVLADLSSENPNVYYELGIRHVLSPNGTVLMCREGSELPFDIKLSRVIFYKFNGVDLDWEEVEQVTQQLQRALEQAKTGAPDSPVHALLESVHPRGDKVAQAAILSNQEHPDPLEEYDAYLKHLATTLNQPKKSMAALIKEHGGNAIGCRLLGHLCLSRNPLPNEASHIAGNLFNCEQYTLAVRIYEKLDQAGKLAPDDLIRYGSSLSERTATLAAAIEGFRFTKMALDSVLARLQANEPTGEDVAQAFKCYQSLSGLLLWQWMLTKKADDLDNAIHKMEEVLQFVESAAMKYDDYAIGRVAQLHLRLLFLLRYRDENRFRPDVEGHREAVLNLKATNSHKDEEVSYLRWYKAIALADAGDGDAMDRMTLKALVSDARLMEKTEKMGIGRRQYKLLRRFIEHHLDVLCNTDLVGQVSRRLQQEPAGNTTTAVSADGALNGKTGCA